MTPTLAAAISDASRWASVAPMIVIFICLPRFSSTSFFSDSRVPIISALFAVITRGIDPCEDNLRFVGAVEETTRLASLLETELKFIQGRFEQ